MTAGIRKVARFAAVGDIFLGDQPACLGFGIRSLARQNGYDSFFAGVRERLSRYDLVVGNLESVIASRETVRKSQRDGLVDRADPEAAAALRYVGIGLVGLANNHIFEYGQIGLDETVRHLDDCGIQWAGKKNYKLVEISGNTVAFLSWSLLPDTYWPGSNPAEHYNVSSTIEPILDDISRVRDNVDYVVLLLHWGNEFISIPSKRQQFLGRSLIDAGVDVILGHHPHVLQPIERYKRGLIVYSLGNFIMDSWGESSRSSIIIEIVFDREIRFNVIPIEITKYVFNIFLVKDCYKYKKILSFVRNQMPLDDCVYLQEVFRLRMHYRISLVIHFLKNFRKFGAKNLLWVLSWGLKRILFLFKIIFHERKNPDVVYKGPMSR